MTLRQRAQQRAALSAVQPVVRVKKSRADDYKLRYASPEHEALPHVVKFSGGRSSGMLLFTLLERGMLKAKRGDVVVFNNTSAEHPATYEFVRHCKAVCEKTHGVPFFWTEFQTYESAVAGAYTRLPAYRFVNDQPHSEDNPDGYHSRGEVFEELVSWTGYLPNQFSGRICTSWMKLFVSKEFLRDWFALKEGIDRLGHFGSASRINLDDTYATHQRNGGETPRDIFLRKKEFCFARPPHRPAMKFADFSPVADYKQIDASELAGKSIGGRVRFSGDFSVDYCAFVGFRGDEPQRLAKMRARLNNADEEANPEADGDDAESYLAAPEGEHVYAPLVQLGKTKDDVVEFWRKKDWGLQLPSDANLSNCVYCFLKGGNGLWQLARRHESANKKIPAGMRAKKGTPADIHWWIDIENKYGRDLLAEGRKITNKEILKDGEKPVIGFFGLMNKMSYGKIDELSTEFRNRKLRGKRRNIFLSEFQNLPCDCTD